MDTVRTRVEPAMRSYLETQWRRRSSDHDDFLQEVWVRTLAAASGQDGDVTPGVLASLAWAVLRHVVAEAARADRRASRATLAWATLHGGEHAAVSGDRVEHVAAVAMVDWVLARLGSWSTQPPSAMSKRARRHLPAMVAWIEETGEWPRTGALARALDISPTTASRLRSEVRDTLRRERERESRHRSYATTGATSTAMVRSS